MLGSFAPRRAFRIGWNCSARDCGFSDRFIRRSLRHPVRGSLALQRPRWRHHQLFRSSAVCLRCFFPALMAPTFVRCSWSGLGSRPYLFLSLTRGLRTALGKHRASPLERPSTFSEFSVHRNQRPGAYLVQLDRLDLCALPDFASWACCFGLSPFRQNRIVRPRS